MTLSNRMTLELYAITERITSHSLVIISLFGFFFVTDLLLDFTMCQPLQGQLQH